MTTAEATTASMIADLNDRFRKGDRTLGKYMPSERVNALTSEQQQELTRLVRVFNDFTEGNDPNGEHDFGIFEFEGEQWEWKIDYYDQRFENLSEDPSDLTKTQRLLSIMHSSEY